VNPSQEIYVSAALPQTKRVMVKDEDVCLHCGLCAERCPTAAWDMRKFELVIPYAFAKEPEAGGRKPEVVGGGFR
jgi:ferredoxin